MFNRRNSYPSDAEAGFAEQFQDLKNQYEANLFQPTEAHTSSAVRIKREYEKNTRDLGVQTYSEPHFQQLLEKPSISIGNVTETTTTKIDQNIQAYGSLFEDIIPGVDRKIWSDVQRNVNSYGVGSVYVQDSLRLASSSTVRDAMRVALDRKIWSDVQRNVNSYGVGSVDVQDSLRLASSSTVRDAMRVALDRKIWSDVQRNVNSYGVSSSYVQDSLRLASSSTVRDAMRVALDRKIWSDVQRNVNSYGVSSSYVQDSLRLASSSTVRDYMKSNVTTRQSHQRSRRTYGAFTDDEFIGDIFTPRYGQTGDNRQNQQSNTGTGSRQYGNNNAGSYSRQQNANTGTKSEHASAPARDPEIDRIVAEAVLKTPSAKWLHSTKQEDIKRVIRTVETLRKTAAEKGETLTDRQIFARYHRAINIPNGEVKPQVKLSYQIIEALMADRDYKNPIKGKLPF